MRSKQLTPESPAATAQQPTNRIDMIRVDEKRSGFRSAGKIGSMLRVANTDVLSGRYRVQLYRFLSDNIPVVSSCIWTWGRLAAAPGEYRIVGDEKGVSTERADARLKRLADRVYATGAGDGNRQGVAAFLPDLFTILFRDGIFGGFLTVHRDGSGVDRFVPVDSADLLCDNSSGKPRLFLESDSARIDLSRTDFYSIPLSGGPSQPLGRSVLQAVPFVSYIEQQLVDDMRRANHNAGFHRLHVKVTPPERMSGESDQAYVDRINGYFDSTVSMIKSCEVDDNPVTWNNVEIEHVGPKTSRGGSNAWFLNHRAMIEDICAGTNLAPFLLGYSYGATNTWSSFKFDVVMRQVKSIQAEVARFMEWIGNVELALAGSDCKCRFVFDNTFAYEATEKMTIENSRVDNILKLYQAGLIDEEAARQKAQGLI